MKGVVYEIKNLIRTVRYIYSTEPVLAPLRDLAFTALTAVEMGQIAAGGKFIDTTADFLLGNEQFVLKEYYLTDSFRWLLITLGLHILTIGITNLRQAIYDHMSKTVGHESEAAMMAKISTVNLQEVEQRHFQELVTFVPNFSKSRLLKTYEAFSESTRNFIRLITSAFILYKTMGVSVGFLVVVAIAEPLSEYFREKDIRDYHMDEVEGIKFVDYLMDISLRIPNFPELKVNGIYRYLRDLYRKEDLRYIHDLVKKINVYFSDKVFWATFGKILQIGYVVYILATAVNRGLSIGDFKALYDYANTVYGASYKTLRNIFTMFDKASYTKEFFEFLDYEGFGEMGDGSKRLGSKTPRLEMKGLHFEYPDAPDIKVLKNINLTVEPGERVAILGGDGSGKSSLVKSLCGLYEIKDQGYYVDDIPVEELRRGELKNRISVVFQSFVRYNISIEDNITISNKKKNVNRTKYEKVKKVAGVSDFMKKEGMGDGQILGKYFEGGREISPGYWQRIAIARMLYRDRAIYVMDEPFTFIDGITREKVMRRILKFLRKDQSLVYITQNTDLLDLFDKIYYLSKW